MLAAVLLPVRANRPIRALSGIGAGRPTGVKVAPPSPE